MDYTPQLDELYTDLRDTPYGCGSKVQFCAHALFDFTTYASEMDEIMGQKMLDVLKAIVNKTTFRYIESSEENYLNYILMVNLPFLADKIEWGTSIRGAWLEDYGEGSYPMYYGNIQVPKKDFSNFVQQLLLWVNR